MTAKLTLVEKAPLPVNQETVRELERMLELARKGLLPGLAFIAFDRSGSYTVGLTGRARFAPVYTRGALRSLEAVLSALID